ncbi:hypothetical protein D031_2502B, partial [Vibrio parahaemolyticus VP-48]
SKTSWLNVSSY